MVDYEYNWSVWIHQNLSPNHIREISLRTKGRVYQAVVRSILPYGCVTWPVRVADERMLEVFDNDSTHCILRVRCRDCVPSGELRRRLCLTSIAALFVQRRLHWFGHATRRPDGELIKDLLLPARPRTWRRLTGGQLKTWSTTIKADLELLSGRESSAKEERIWWKFPVSSHSIVEPGVPPFETWSAQLVMPAEPALGECRLKYK